MKRSLRCSDFSSLLCAEIDEICQMDMKKIRIDSEPNEDNIDSTVPKPCEKRNTIMLKPSLSDDELKMLTKDDHDCRFLWSSPFCVLNTKADMNDATTDLSREIFDQPMQ